MQLTYHLDELAVIVVVDVPSNANFGMRLDGEGLPGRLVIT